MCSGAAEKEGSGPSRGARALTEMRSPGDVATGALSPGGSQPQQCPGDTRWGTPIPLPALSSGHESKKRG